MVQGTIGTAFVRSVPVAPREKGQPHRPPRRRLAAPLDLMSERPGMAETAIPEPARRSLPRKA